MRLKEDETICDRCANYEVSPGGCVETCHAKREGSRFIIWMPDDYVQDRMNKEKTNCKAFKKLFKRY